MDKAKMEYIVDLYAKIESVKDIINFIGNASNVCDDDRKEHKAILFTHGNGSVCKSITMNDNISIIKSILQLSEVYYTDLLKKYEKEFEEL